MTRPNLTKGPWEDVPTSSKGAGTARRDIVSNGTDFSPAFIAGDILPQDAKAIAAVPDLLAALEYALPWLHCEKGNENGPHAKIIAALTKAGYTFIRHKIA